MPAIDIMIAAARLNPRAKHYLPIYLAARDQGIALDWLFQKKHRDLPRMPPKSMLIVGDDLPPGETELGPTAFHQGSLRRCLNSCTHVAIMSGSAISEVYEDSARFAALGARVVLIETGTRAEAQWLDYVRSTAPQADLLVVTVAAGRA